MKDVLKYFGWYQIAGGVFGIGMILWVILQSGVINNLTVLIIVLTLAFYSFSIYCGSLLIKGETGKGINLSIINQILQVFHFSVLGVTYKYVSGVLLAIGIDYTTDFIVKFDFSLSAIDISYYSNGDDLIVMTNIIPLVLIGYLNKVQSTATEDSVFLERDDVNDG